MVDLEGIGNVPNGTIKVNISFGFLDLVNFVLETIVKKSINKNFILKIQAVIDDQIIITQLLIKTYLF